MTYMLGPCSVPGCPFHHGVTVSRKARRPRFDDSARVLGVAARGRAETGGPDASRSPSAGGDLPTGIVKPMPATPDAVTPVAASGISEPLPGAAPSRRLSPATG